MFNFVKTFLVKYVLFAYICEGKSFSIYGEKEYPA